MRWTIILKCIYTNHSKLKKSLKHRLMKNGFSSNFIEGCVGKVLNKYHAGVDDKKHEDEDDHRKVILTLPYLRPISIILRRNL